VDFWPLIVHYLTGHIRNCRVLEGHLRKLILAKLFMLAVVTSSSRVHAETEPSLVQGRKLVVVNAIDFIAEGLPRTVHDREQFLARLRKNLSERGWTAVVPPTNAACAGGNECLSALAHGARAPYALRITGEGNLVRGYTLQLHLYSPATKRSQQATAYCDVCVTERVAGIAADFALRLIDDAEKEARVFKGEDRTTVATVATAKMQPPPARAITVVPAADQPSPSHVVPVLSWSVVGVGILGMAYGGWAIFKNGDDTGERDLTSTKVLARDKYSTTTVGATALAVGGALALVGAILLITEPAHGGVSLASTPDGISVRF